MLAVALAVPGAQALDKPGTVTVTASELRHAHIDIGARGPSVGDVDVYTSLIYNKQITPRAIGRGDDVLHGSEPVGPELLGDILPARGARSSSEGVIGSRLIYAARGRRRHRPLQQRPRRADGHLAAPQAAVPGPARLPPGGVSGAQARGS